MQDIRWIQRLSNYQRARQRLTDAVELAAKRELSDLEKLGLIQAFEFVFELAWNLMKDYFVYQAMILRSVSAFKAGAEWWLMKDQCRNQFNTYNESVTTRSRQDLSHCLNDLIAMICRQQ